MLVITISGKSSADEAVRRGDRSPLRPPVLHDGGGSGAGDLGNVDPQRAMERERSTILNGQTHGKTRGKC